MSHFFPRGTYQSPAPVVVAPGEPLTICSSTVHVISDSRGRELGRLVEAGVGTQRSQEAIR